MKNNRCDYISDIERRKADRINTSSGYRLDMAERLIDYPQGFIETFLDELNDEDFIVYPKEELVKELQYLISSNNSVSLKNVLIDSGSDAIIKNCYHSLCNERESIVIGDPSFPMYRIYANMFGLELIEVGYDNSLNFDLQKIIESIDDNTRMVVLANPNSPYGDIQIKSDIVDLLNILESKDIYLLLDEAYVDFGGESMSGLIKKFGNLIVLKTFSKAWGAAGSRVGYCLSNQENIRQIEKVQLTYPVSNTSIKFAIYLYKNHENVDRYIKETIRERDELVARLQNLDYDVFPSSNNSIHFHDKEDNSRAVGIFKKHNVSFKTGTTASTPLKVPGDSRDTWIRIGVGSGILDAPYIQELLVR